MGEKIIRCIIIADGILAGLMILAAGLLALLGVWFEYVEKRAKLCNRCKILAVLPSRFCAKCSNSISKRIGETW